MLHSILTPSITANTTTSAFLCIITCVHTVHTTTGAFMAADPSDPARAAVHACAFLTLAAERALTPSNRESYPSVGGQVDTLHT
jgi:hydroxyethylthiazole kinase-like sugar kinase family protein